MDGRQRFGLCHGAKTSARAGGGARWKDEIRQFATLNGWKRKALKFTRKIRGLSFAFGGAGGFEPASSPVFSRPPDRKLS